MADSARTDVVRLTRRRILLVLVAVIVVSFAIAAAAGITVLVIGPAGELMDRVLVTTLIVGGFSVGALSCISLWGRRAHLFGLAGVAVNVASAAIALISVWVHSDSEDFWWVMNRLLTSGLILSAGCALAALLLLLSTRRRPVIRIGLVITEALIALVVVLALAGVWWEAVSDAEPYPRVLGTVGILCALGVVVVPVLALLIRDRRGESDAGGLPPVVAERLLARAQERGISVEELVAPVLADPPDGSVPGGRAEQERMRRAPTLGQ